MLYLSGVRSGDMPLLITPDSRYHVPAAGPWAVDNGCYANPADYTDERYMRWLERHAPARCLFATAPDVWGDAAATLERSLPMLERISQVGYPPALCAQDGMLPADVPWAAIAALFVGGTDTWRATDALAQLIDEAKRRGKWVHVGRINSRRRFDWCRSLGADSADGTVLRFDPGRPVAEWVVDAANRPMLWRD